LQGSRVYPVVTANGVGVVSHAGTLLLSELADRFGLSAITEAVRAAIATLLCRSWAPAGGRQALGM
jgi:hypothetical protein